MSWNLTSKKSSTETEYGLWNQSKISISVAPVRKNHKTSLSKVKSLNGIFFFNNKWNNFIKSSCVQANQEKVVSSRKKIAAKQRIFVHGRSLMYIEVLSTFFRFNLSKYIFFGSLCTLASNCTWNDLERGVDWRGFLDENILEKWERQEIKCHENHSSQSPYQKM